MTTATAAPPLDPDALERFDRLGYLVHEAFLPAAMLPPLIADVDAWMRAGADGYVPPERRGAVVERVTAALPACGPLITHPPAMALVEQLLGPGFAFHHLHTTRFDPGAPGVHWHQDYEQVPNTNRSHRMVHAFYYLSGLDGTIGDLLLLPGSQRMVVDNGALEPFGTADLPGSIAIDRLAPGSLVLVHSALLHARRAKPGGAGRARYFVDVSYCQAGIRWPSTYGDWRRKLAVARACGIDRGGRWAHLFDEAHFFDGEAARAAAAKVEGSLVTG